MLQKNLYSALFCILFFLCSYIISAHNLPVRIITEEFPPYIYTEKNKITGAATEIMRKIMEDLDVNCEINCYPDGRVEKMLENSKSMIAYPLFKTPERERKLKLIGPLTTEDIYMYKKKTVL